MLYRGCSQGIKASELHKKKVLTFYKERDETARQNWLLQLLSIPEDTRVFVDETGFCEFLFRDKCRCKRGENVCIGVPGRRFARTNIVAGLQNGRLISPLEYNGTTDHIVFEFWFSEMLLPSIPAGSTIIMDNATFHRKKILTELALEAKCNVLFLPPYSPDYNPIEKKWANMKKYIRNYGYKHENFQYAINETF